MTQQPTIQGSNFSASRRRAAQPKQHNEAPYSSFAQPSSSATSTSTTTRTGKTTFGSTPQKIICPSKTTSPVNRTVSTTSSITTTASITCSRSANTSEASDISTSMMEHQQRQLYSKNNYLSNNNAAEEKMFNHRNSDRMFYDDLPAEEMAPTMSSPPSQQSHQQQQQTYSALKTVTPTNADIKAAQTKRSFASSAPLPPPTPVVVSPDNNFNAAMPADNVSAFATMDDCYSETSKSTFPPPPPVEQHPFTRNMTAQEGNNTTVDKQRHSRYMLRQHPMAHYRKDGNEDWRRHGRAYRAKLIQHDEATGLHDFELSNECSIKRYHLVAERVLSQFMETREDPHVDLRDTYLVGTRLSKFLSIVLPMHKDFNSPDPELSEMRRKSHAQWLTLTHYLEELALIIDEEEHSQFVLRDLNESGEEEQPVMDVPPELVVGKTKKRHGSKQQPSKNNEFVEENRPHPFPSTVEDNAASANPPQNSFHTASVNQQQHPNNNSNCNYNSILNRGEDPWQTVDATTVASLDTHWFSSAFSEPFPVSTGDEHDKSDRSDRKKATEHALLDEDEQIVQISGSSRSSKSKQQNTFMDTADIPFGNLTLEEEARNLDFFATQMTKPSSEHSFQNAPVVTPIDKRGSSSDNKKNNNAWRIAPAPSDRPLLKQSPLANNNSHIKDDWGSSPFHVDDKPQFSWAEPASSIKQQPSAMDMSPFWDEETAPQPEPRKSSKTSETPANSKQDPGEMLHSKGKVSKRPFSRYMALDEHKKKQSDRQSGKSNNARNSRNSERRPLRHYEQDCGDDTDFDKIGAMLDGNKARARREYNGAPALRQRGIHHMKECVRCLLE